MRTCSARAIRSGARRGQSGSRGPDRAQAWGSPVVIRYAQLYPQHTVALVLVDGLMPALQNPNAKGLIRPKRSVAMAGPSGPRNRETMIRGFFSASTTPAMQTKILDMMLAAPEATAVGTMDATDDPTTPADFVVKVPTLGIYAGRGPMASRPSIQAHFPDSEYTQIPDTGPLPDDREAGRVQPSAAGLPRQQKY